jgi:transposase
MTTTRKTFTAEFKLDAIKLAKSNGNIEETARNLGIGAGALHRWIRQQKQHNAEGRPTFTGKGKPALTEQEAQIKQLERDLEIARQERDILKKAVACLDHTAAPSGLVASLPRNPNEIPIHSEPPGRV